VLDRGRVCWTGPTDRIAPELGVVSVAEAFALLTGSP
ncbi:ABC transporter ATP-binding protein, partial [Mesorhizobium sp. M2A.F.Ca.ET.046.02.1.1]